MLNKLKQRKSDGFTIIEVMIVLAIAGLIMLIVFLAVPALQRNAHNTSIKNDVAGILGAMNEAVNNNSGTVPTATTGSNANTFVATGGAGYNKADAKLGYITGSSVTIAAYSVGVVPPAVGSVKIVTSATCNGNAAASGTPRQYVALFTLEGGALQCQAS